MISCSTGSCNLPSTVRVTILSSASLIVSRLAVVRVTNNKAGTKPTGKCRA